MAFSLGHSAVPFTAEVEHTAVRGPQLVDFDLDLTTLVFTNPGWTVDLRGPEGREAVEHLKSGKVFDVSEHPRMSFRATGANSLGGNWYHLYGDLSLRGQSSEVVLEVFVRQPLSDDGRLMTHIIRGQIDPRPFGIEYQPDATVQGVAGEVNGKLFIQVVTELEVNGC